MTYAAWTPFTDTHELAVQFRGLPAAEVATAVMYPYGPRPAVTRYVRRSVLDGAREVLLASWRAAWFTRVMTVAAILVWVGLRLLDAVLAVAS